jgi:hypothetical protein
VIQIKTNHVRTRNDEHGTNIIKTSGIGTNVIGANEKITIRAEMSLEQNSGQQKI